MVFKNNSSNIVLGEFYFCIFAYKINSMTIEIVFYVAVMLLSLLVFSMKITAHGTWSELLLKTAGKVIPLFCILYSGLKLFKLIGVEI